ncbi:MAG: MotE family protein [Wujia sp.]
MAKDKEKKGGNKGIGFLIAILILTTWLSVMCLLIKCDVGGFGSKVLRPVFKDVPVIKTILPDASDEEIALEDDYPYDNLADALAQIKVMDETIGNRDAEIVALKDKNEELQEENNRLSALEEEKTKFEEQKNKFYDEIVYGETAPDTDTYKEWYNELDAEKAEAIYRDILAGEQVDNKIKEMAKSYEAMDAKNAADIITSMGNDLDTVALILNQMNAESKGKILAEMEPGFAAAVTKKLMP